MLPRFELGEEELNSAVQIIAEKLQETEERPLQEIRDYIRYFGPEEAYNIVLQALEVEANGGMTFKRYKKMKRRTIGGIFFYIATHRWREETGYSVGGAESESDATIPIFDWETRRELIQSLQPGEVTKVQINLIGRPVQVEERRECVVFSLQDKMKKLPTFPKGLPQLPQRETVYTVYVASKQWRKVSQAIANPNDELVITGYMFYDPDAESNVVYANSVTTKMIDREKRKSGDTSGGDTDAMPVAAPAPAVSAPKKPQTPVARPVTPPPQAVPSNDPPPPEVVRRLAELRIAERTARETFEEIKQLPPDEQSGLTQALREVQQITAAIKELQQRYPRLK